MTCSSSTTSPPERVRPGQNRKVFGLFAVACGLGLSLPLAAAQLAADRALAEARRALVRGDGVAAEARLRDARRAGASDDLVRASMGEALLAQGDMARARDWLGHGNFGAGTAGRGYRMLGRLEMRQGRLPEAGRAFDAALATASRDPDLWTDIARLRFKGGEQAGALDASARAVRFGPSNAEALRFRGLLIRQQVGYQAAVPWLDAAIAHAPANAGMLLDRAAARGEIGRYSAALDDLRKAEAIAPRNPLVVYQQAVIAARAGDRALARRLLQRSKNRLHDLPGAVLLAAALELDAGNTNLAIGYSDRLLRLQPDNRYAQAILARALLRSGDADTVIKRFHAIARDDPNSLYLRSLVARALEENGQRAAAIELLAGAGSATPRGVALLGSLPDAPTAQPGYQTASAAVPAIRSAIGQNRAADAAEMAERLFRSNRGAPAAATIAGDMAALQGRIAQALDAYQLAAQIEFSEAQLVRLDRALRAVARQRDADLLLVAFSAQRPQSLVGTRLLANLRARGAQWKESGRLLEWSTYRAGRRDPGLLADWAYAEYRLGRREEARKLAASAALVDPANSSARQVANLVR